MEKFTATVTSYKGGKDRVSNGLTLDQAIQKVVRNIYGYDEKLDFIASSIQEDCNGKFGAAFFCSMATGLVSIKLEG